LDVLNKAVPSDAAVTFLRKTFPDTYDDVLTIALPVDF